MIIELLNGERFDISDYGLTRLFHHIPTPEVKHTSSQIGGIGDTITDTTIGQRTISVDLLFQVMDIYDYYLLRDEIHALFVREEAFYIIFKREPYKRWLVKLADGFKITPNPKAGLLTIEFKTVKRFGESIGTTADSKEWDADKWGWNNTINWDADLRYTFNSSNFTVKNLGTATIDPRDNELEIVVRASAASYLRIVNVTTGDEYRYNGPLSSSDILKLKGVRSFKNNVSAFGNTNRKLLTLAPGDNQFVVEGGIVQDIAFNFRFLYK